MKKGKKACLITSLYIEMMLALLLSGCGDDEFTISTRDQLEQIQDDTLLDEVLESAYGYDGTEDRIKYVTKKINKLEKALMLSEKLHDLRLDKKVDINNLPSNIKDLSFKEIGEVIEAYEGEKLPDSVATILYHNEGIVNDWIYNNGYDIIIEFDKYLVTAKIMELYNKEQKQKGYAKISTDEFDKFKLYIRDEDIDCHRSCVIANENVVGDLDLETPEGKDISNDNGKYKRRQYEIELDGELNTVVDSILECTENKDCDLAKQVYGRISRNIEGKAMHDSERNKNLRDAVEAAREGMIYKYKVTITDGKYRTVGTGKRLIKE